MGGANILSPCSLSESCTLGFQSGGAARLTCVDPRFMRDVAMFSAEPSRIAVLCGPLLLSGSHGARGNHDHDPRTDGTPHTRDARGFHFSAATPPFRRPVSTNERDLGPLHHACFPWQVGTMVRRLGVGAGGRPRPARTSHWWPNPRLHRVGERPRSGARFQPRAGSDPVPGRERTNFTDGVARLSVKASRASPGPVPPPAWINTGVNDVLMATSLKALTTDQFSAELVVPAAICEPLYANQAARTTLLVIMLTLDDVDIAPVQRGD
jgi:hypothetical protein